MSVYSALGNALSLRLQNGHGVPLRAEDVFCHTDRVVTGGSVAVPQPSSAGGHIYKVSPDVEVGSAMRLVLARLDAAERAIDALRAELAGRRGDEAGTVATEAPVSNPFRVFPEDRRRVGG